MEQNVVFVVEGKNDFAKLKKLIPNSNIIITNGSEISDVVLEEIKTLSSDKRIILMLDPDGPGEKIRRKIANYVPESEHVFVQKSKAISKNKKKVGIEHLSDEDLFDAIGNIKVPTSSANVNIGDLYKLGLVGKANSKRLRQYLCDKLGIGTANAKTLLYKLNMFGFSIDDIEKIIKR